MAWKRTMAVGALWVVVAAGSTRAQLGELERGYQALDRGDLEVAQPIFTRAAAESLLVLAASQQGEAQKATLTRAAELAPADATALRQRIQGLQLLSDGKAADAAKVFAEVATAEPRDKRAQYLLGISRQRAGDRPGAVAALRAATALDGDYGVAHLALGDALRESGDFAGAYNAYNHAVSPEGRPVAALLGRAGTRMLLGDEEGALPDLELAARVAAPGMDRYRALMGFFYLKTYERKLAEGIGHVEQAVAMWQELGRTDMAVAACNAAGRVYLETGDPEGGERWYQVGWDLVAGSRIAAEERAIWQVRMLHGKARAAAARRDLTAADALVAQARTAMDADPKNAEHYRWIYPYLKAYVELARRDPDAAIANLQAVPESEMRRPYLLYMMAEAYARKRDRDTARIWYERALAASSGLDADTAIVRPLALAWLEKNPVKS